MMSFQSFIIVLLVAVICLDSVNGGWRWRRRRRSCGAVHGGWSGWAWVHSTGCVCDHNLGTGTHSFIRYCNNPSPSCGGSSCSGSSTLINVCNSRCCKITNGGWSNWAAIGKCTCDHTYGTGTITHKRYCNNPIPSCGGVTCSGSSTMTGRCDSSCCKITHGGWTNWGSWTKCKCDPTTGTGTKSATRTCTSPAPSCGGNSCSGSATKRGSCDDQCCKITHGGWTNWGDWTKCKCDPTTGTGTKSATRSCTSPAPACGGNTCSGSVIQGGKCDDQCCKITHGGWSSWSNWVSQCDVYCGPGVQYRNRTCTSPLPSCLGESCKGVASVTSKCNDHCGVIVVEDAITTGEPATVSCTIHAAKRVPDLVLWRNTNGETIISDELYVVTVGMFGTEQQTTSLKVMNASNDEDFICVFTFGEDELTAEVFIEYVDFDIGGWT